MSDLNAIAHGVDTETGEYLSPEQRKALFRSRKMGSKINTRAFTSGTYTATKGSRAIVKVERGSGLVKSEDLKQESSQESQQQADFESNEAKTLFEELRSKFYEVHTVKNDKKRLQSKFLDLLAKKKSTPQVEPAEDKKSFGMPKALGKIASKIPLNPLGLVGDLLQFAVLSWLGDPKNKKIVETFTTILRSVFKFLDWWLTTALDNLLSGFAEMVGGDSILERIGGFFKFAAGFFGLRWLLNPLKMIKDLKGFGKIASKFIKIFRGIFKLGEGGLKKGIGETLKLFGKAFRTALGRTIQRFFIKLFGKAFTKGLKSFAKVALKGATKLVGKFPLIGPIIAFGINLALGEPVGRAAFKAIGATLLAGLGGIIGSIIPGAGTFLGGLLGGLLGDWAGGAMYDLFFKGKESDKGSDTPEMETGGIASGPKSGYLVTLHGTEVVIPIARIGEILALPFKALGAGLIGGMLTVINSIGPAAGFVKPLMSSILGPAMKLFGIEKYTKSDRVGKTQGSSETVANDIEREREKKDLGKIFGIDTLKDIGSTLLAIGGSLFSGPAQASSSSGGGQGVVNRNASGEESATPGTTGNYKVSDSYDRGLADLLRDYEGLRLNAYPDPASKGEPYTIGIGATYYPPGFRLRGKVRMGDTITEEEAYWIKQQHILDHRKRLLGEIGSSVYNKLPDGVKAALESKVFNYGSLKEPLVSMVKTSSETGDYSKVSAYFRNNLAKHNNGINSWRRNDEANLIDSGSSTRAKISFNNLPSTPSLATTPPTQTGATGMVASAGVTSPPKAQLSPGKSPSTASMVPMSNTFTMDRKVRSTMNSSRSSTVMLSNFNTYNANVNAISQPINITSISASILQNRI